MLVLMLFTNCPFLWYSNGSAGILSDISKGASSVDELFVPIDTTTGKWFQFSMRDSSSLEPLVYTTRLYLQR